MLLDINTKDRLLALCIGIKEESAANIQAAMDDAQQSANEYGSPKDRYDSFRAQLMRKRDMLAQQLAQTEEELRFLRQIKPGVISKRVEPGSLVALNSQILYVLLGIGKVTIDGVTVYVVSPVVPLVESMKNLKSGDSFSFRGQNMTIKEIV